MSSHYTENLLELTLLEWFGGMGYKVLSGPDIAHDAENPMRRDYADVLLLPELREALSRINPSITLDIVEEVIKKLQTLPSHHILAANESFHRMLTDGIDIEVQLGAGEFQTLKIYLIDKETIKNNSFVAVNQMTIIEHAQRRPDIILYINGLPVGVIELKNMIDEDTDSEDAYAQLQTYKQQIPTLFHYNELLIISDGVTAQAGTLSADRDRFMSWKSIDGETVATPGKMLESLIYGMCMPERLINLILSYIVFEQQGKQSLPIKKIAAYHQYFAVEKAVEKTFTAVSKDQKCGVVRHTQGSGKSLTMVFYAAKIIQSLDNPTLVIITDRNDLDDQLHDTFVDCAGVLRQIPKQAESRTHLRQLLDVNSGGIVFTTIQKFQPDGKETTHPELSDRSNIIIIADEAHRTQYGLTGKIDTETGQLNYGYAKYLRDALPNASFIGFTGTPIEFTDKSTPAIFGDYIDIYDIYRSVEDKATVPIYYESRLAKIALDESMKPHIDNEFEELTEGEEIDMKEQLKTKRAQLEAMVGTENRLALIAQDIISHFETRCSIMDGKGMIVAMSRRVAAELYDQIIKLRPDWHSDDESDGVIKVVITGSASDPLTWQQHIRNKEKRKALELRMKNPEDKLKLVIVRDMWLTGFDVPSLHTMYVDKPMKGHGLMQAIARVNRVYKDKQGGLIVDYLGIANELKTALSQYTQDPEEMQKQVPSIESAIALLKEKYEIVKAMFHGYEYMQFFSVSPAQKTAILAGALEHILNLERESVSIGHTDQEYKNNKGRKRYIEQSTQLMYALSLTIATDEGTELRDEIAFFQAIRAMLLKLDSSDIGSQKGKSQHYDHAIKQIISDAVATDGVIDVFKVAGIEKPEIGILSEEFLKEVSEMKHKNLAFELLKKLLNGSIKTIGKRNIIKGRSFTQMLEDTIKRYQNRTIESAQVMAELIELARKMREEQHKAEQLGLSPQELAFYDALAANESAARELGDPVLKEIARQLVELIRKNMTIDWTLKESVQATLRFYIKKLLRQYKYPPDAQTGAIELVMKQAKINAEEEANI